MANDVNISPTCAATGKGNIFGQCRNQGTRRHRNYRQDSGSNQQQTRAEAFHREVLDAGNQSPLLSRLCQPSWISPANQNREL
jgi:hypothetical protein